MRILKLLKTVFLIFANVGVAAWVASISYSTFISDDNAARFREYRFPLSKPRDIEVSTDGKVLVTLEFYGRIQVYDLDGRFLYGFRVDAGGGRVGTHLDGEGNLIVIPARGDHAYVHTIEGTLKKRVWKEGTKFHDLLEKSFRPASDNQGQTYHIEDGFFNPQIIRTERSGHAIVLTESAIWMRPFAGPGPMFLMMIGGAIGFQVCRFFIDRLERDDLRPLESSNNNSAPSSG